MEARCYFISEDLLLNDPTGVEEWAVARVPVWDLERELVSQNIVLLYKDMMEVINQITNFFRNKLSKTFSVVHDQDVKEIDHLLE
eukprot:351288-Hanusia_phi.AAC.1